ncbi:MAG: hypothetical protein Q9208_007834 [Pyrenodesmia sp. 3 TL-2023]
MHHIASPGYGTIPKLQMQGAILQSSVFFPRPNGTQDDEMYTKFLELAQAKDLDALWTADTKVLQNANAKMVHEAQYGYFNFDPTIYYRYVPDLPGQILARGDIALPALLLGHEKLDGLFTPPWIRTTEALLDHVRVLFPGVPQSVLDMVASEYPVPTNSGPQASLLATTEFFNDIANQCNSMYLTQASLKEDQIFYPHPVYRYVFNTLPAVHGYDLGYTYFPSPPPIAPVDETLAKYFQEAIVNFTRYLDPNPQDSTFWDEYPSENPKVMNMGDPLQTAKSDYTHSLGPDLLNTRLCEYWEFAPWNAPAASKGGSDPQFVVQNEEL